MSTKTDLWDQLDDMVSMEFGTDQVLGLAASHALPGAGFESYADFVSRVNPDFRWFRHNVLLAEVAQQIADGQLKRVMIWVPPGTGKSETISRLLAAYYLYRFPFREVGLVSYGANLAEDLAGDAREYFLEGGGELDPSTKAKGAWRTNTTLSNAGGYGKKADKKGKKGGMWGAGFAGPIRGKRFHLGIIDDPHKGPEELESDALRNKIPSWWNRTWLNRQNLFFEEGAAIAIVMQRLHESDLCGWLLEQPDADQWTIVALDAVRSEESWFKSEGGPIPDECTVWTDWRQTGELLCPEALGEKRLKEQQGDMDAYVAQFLQRPRRISGAIFQREWFKVIHGSLVPMLYRKVIGGDLAVSTKDGADYTVFFPIGYGIDGNYYLFEPYRARSEAPDSEKGAVDMIRKHMPQMVGIESVAFQLSFVQYLRRNPMIAGFPILEVPADKDKLARARGWTPMAAAGQIFLVDEGGGMRADKTGWIDVLLDEAVSFPKKKKDQIDSIGVGLAAIQQIDPGTGPLVGGGSRTTGADHLTAMLGRR